MTGPQEEETNTELVREETERLEAQGNREVWEEDRAPLSSARAAREVEEGSPEGAELPIGSHQH